MRVIRGDTHAHSQDKTCTVFALRGAPCAFARERAALLALYANRPSGYEYTLATRRGPLLAHAHME